MYSLVNIKKITGCQNESRKTGEARNQDLTHGRTALKTVVTFAKSVNSIYLYFE
jgi:hypothetical protein